MESQLPAAEAPVVSPELTVDQLARVRAYGTPDVVDVGEAAFAAGDPTYDLVVIEAGVIAMPSDRERSRGIADHVWSGRVRR